MSYRYNLNLKINSNFKYIVGYCFLERLKLHLKDIIYVFFRMLLLSSCFCEISQE